MKFKHRIWVFPLERFYFFLCHCRVSCLEKFMWFFQRTLIQIILFAWRVIDSYSWKPICHNCGWLASLSGMLFSQVDQTIWDIFIVKAWSFLSILSVFCWANKKIIERFFLLNKKTLYETIKHSLTVSWNIRLQTFETTALSNIA